MLSLIILECIPVITLCKTTKVTISREGCRPLIIRHIRWWSCHQNIKEEIIDMDYRLEQQSKNKLLIREKKLQANRHKIITINRY